MASARQQALQTMMNPRMMTNKIQMQGPGNYYAPGEKPTLIERGQDVVTDILEEAPSVIQGAKSGIENTGVAFKRALEQVMEWLKGRGNIMAMQQKDVPDNPTFQAIRKAFHSK